MAPSREKCHYANFFTPLAKVSFDTEQIGPYPGINDAASIEEDSMKITKVKRISRGLCKCKSSC